MTYTEKILEEFDEKFDRVVLENPFSETEELSNELLTLKKWAGLFLSSKIAQARAEERDRVIEESTLYFRVRQIPLSEEFINIINPKE